MYSIIDIFLVENKKLKLKKISINNINNIVESLNFLLYIYKEKNI